MKTMIRTATVLLCLTLFHLTLQAQPNGEYLVRTIPAPSLSNNLLNDPASLEIHIYLPPSYHEVGYAFPVLYFLAGWNCASILRIAEYEARLSQDNMEEMIVVLVKGCNRLQGSWYVNSVVTGNWEDVIRFDVINYIDSNFRTIRKNQCRGIAGHSMGGFGAFNMAMKFPNIFNSYYGASPTLLNNNYLEDFFGFNDDDFVKNCIDYLESLKADYREIELQNLTNTFLNQPVFLQCVLSLGAAFAPDANGHVPYLHFPYSLNENRQLIENDSMLNIWLDALGNWDKKIELSYHNLLTYDTLIFNYGDEEDVTGRGVRNVYDITKKYDIESSIIVHEGGHIDDEPLYAQMFPAMSKTLWRDSSRFRTGTEILAFELDHQVRETIIDSENATVEAFVSDTASIETIIPHMTLSDGAWEIPIANQELDFSWGPIVFRVKSGDGQNQKLWTVTVTQISTSGIDSHALGGLSLFPNPARNSLFIHLPVPCDGLEFHVYNLMGAAVMSGQRLISNQINIENLTKGVYFLRITGRDVNYLAKFIKD